MAEQGDEELAAALESLHLNAAPRRPLSRLETLVDTRGPGDLLLNHVGSHRERDFLRTVSRAVRRSVL